MILQNLGMALSFWLLYFVWVEEHCDVLFFVFVGVPGSDVSVEVLAFGPVGHQVDGFESVADAGEGFGVETVEEVFRNEHSLGQVVFHDIAPGAFREEIAFLVADEVLAVGPEDELVVVIFFHGWVV